MFELRDFIYLKVNQLKELANMGDYDIKCYNEQEFASAGIKENELSIVVKRMSSTLTFNTITTPYQILILSEENSSELAFALMDKFATDNNWTVVSSGTSKIKLQFSQPMTMSNFELVDGSYRSVLFISATAYELENVADIENLTIDGVLTDKYISVVLGYGATMNTEQFPSAEIANSIKTVAAFTLVLVVPCQATELVQKALSLTNGSYNGNEDFAFSFSIGGVNFNKSLKLVNCDFVTAAADIPSITLGFME